MVYGSSSGVKWRNGDIMEWNAWQKMEVVSAIGFMGLILQRVYKIVQNRSHVSFFDWKGSERFWMSFQILLGAGLIFLGIAHPTDTVQQWNFVVYGSYTLLMGMFRIDVGTK